MVDCSLQKGMQPPGSSEIKCKIKKGISSNVLRMGDVSLNSVKWQVMHSAFLSEENVDSKSNCSMPVN